LPARVVHERHFSPDEANALLEWVESRIIAIREARDRLADPAAHGALAEAGPMNGGGTPGRTVGEAFLELRGLLVELQQAGLVLRDLDRGLVDFPALRGGREVYLCWEFGEHRIGFWHELDTGFAGREPLE
jgi:hypothetical protein